MQNSKRPKLAIYTSLNFPRGIGPLPNVNDRKLPQLGTEAGGKLAELGRHAQGTPQKRKACPEEAVEARISKEAGYPKDQLRPVSQKKDAERNLVIMRDEEKRRGGW
jgi:hypothetical protein